jgi:hypothetical protein
MYKIVLTKSIMLNNNIIIIQHIKLLNSNATLFTVRYLCMKYCPLSCLELEPLQVSHATRKF